MVFMISRMFSMMPSVGLFSPARSLAVKWVLLLSLSTFLLTGLVTAQYAGAVSVARVHAAANAPQAAGDWRSRIPYRLPAPSQRIVKVLCPHEVGLLLRAIARATQLSGLVASVYLLSFGLKGMKNGKAGCNRSLLRGATIFGATWMAPEIIRGLSHVSLGFMPF